MSTDLAERPAHVPEALVRDWDFHEPGEGWRDDVQAAYAALQRDNPEVFWTPRNGGHWVMTRTPEIVDAQMNPARYSYRHITLPVPPADHPVSIPLELDPPVHAEYRRPLMQALTPANVRGLEEKVRRIAIEAIEKVLPQGECEFVEDFAKVLPIHIFMDLVALPLEDIPMLLPIADSSVRARNLEERLNAQQAMGGYLYKWVMERRAKPGDDLLSMIVNTEVGGQRISDQEAVSYASLVLFGGLDTVAGMLGFVARFLAEHPEHRRRIRENLADSKFITGAIEELLRRHGIANTARIAVEDFTVGGVEIRKGDLILPPNQLVGLDDRVNEDPLTVNFDRKKPVHAVFGNGPHACPGAALARRELRIFLEEWLTRIPEFSINPGTKPVLGTGSVSGVLKLELVW
jgi:cytochrome P450